MIHTAEQVAVFIEEESSDEIQQQQYLDEHEHRLVLHTPCPADEEQQEDDGHVTSNSLF